MEDNKIEVVAADTGKPVADKTANSVRMDATIGVESKPYSGPSYEPKVWGNMGAANRHMPRAKRKAEKAAKAARRVTRSKNK